MRGANGDVKINRSASLIGDKSEGVVQYSWVDGDTDTAGVYFVEIHVLFNSGKTEIFPSRGFEHVQVEEDLLP